MLTTASPIHNLQLLPGANGWEFVFTCNGKNRRVTVSRDTRLPSSQACLDAMEDYIEEGMIDEDYVVGFARAA
jgi:hypothetical protein